MRFSISEKWEKKNIRFHNNGTVTFNQEKIYVFDESQSVGLEDDVVVVPNIPMLVSTNKKKQKSHVYYVCLFYYLPVRLLCFRPCAIFFFFF